MRRYVFPGNREWVARRREVYLWPECSYRRADAIGVSIRSGPNRRRWYRREIGVEPATSESVVRQWSTNDPHMVRQARGLRAVRASSSAVPLAEAVEVW